MSGWRGDREFSALGWRFAALWGVGGILYDIFSRRASRDIICSNLRLKPSVLLVPELETSLIADRAQICHETLDLNGRGLGRFTEPL